MPGDRRGTLGVTIGGDIVIHMIAKLIAQRDRLNMVMVIIASLMGQRRIKGDRLVDIRIAIPNTIAGVLHFCCRRVHIREGIAVVEKRNPVDETSDRPTACRGLRRRHSRHPRDPIDGRGVGWEIWKGVRPGPHEMTRQSTGPDVNPVGRCRYLADIGIGWTTLDPRPSVPSSGLSACSFRGATRVDPSVLTRVGGEPRGDLRIRVNRA